MTSARDTSGRLRARRRTRGSAALEFGVLLPIFFLIVLAMTDWALAIEQRLRLQGAARAGAEVALVNPADTNAIRNAVRAAAPDLSTMVVQATAVWCECSGAGVSCTASCPGPMARFIRVRASNALTPLSPIGPSSVSGDVTLRLQ